MDKIKPTTANEKRRVKRKFSRMMNDNKKKQKHLELESKLVKEYLNEL